MSWKDGVWQAGGYGGPHAGFVIIRRLLGLVGLDATPEAKDVEIAVLRHQLMVLRRYVARPGYAPTDRMVLAVLARRRFCKDNGWGDYGEGLLDQHVSVDTR